MPTLYFPFNNKPYQRLPCRIPKPCSKWTRGRIITGDSFFWSVPQKSHCFAVAFVVWISARQGESSAHCTRSPQVRYQD